MISIARVALSVKCLGVHNSTEHIMISMSNISISWGVISWCLGATLGGVMLGAMVRGGWGLTTKVRLSPPPLGSVRLGGVVSHNIFRLGGVVSHNIFGLYNYTNEVSVSFNF